MFYIKDKYFLETKTLLLPMHSNYGGDLTKPKSDTCLNQGLSVIHSSLKKGSIDMEFMSASEPFRAVVSYLTR